MNNRSGGIGILGLAGLVAAFFILRKFVPALAKLFLILGGIAAIGVVVLVIMVLFLAFRKPKKTPEEQSVLMAHSLTPDINLPELKAGRMPEKVLIERFSGMFFSVLLILDLT